MQELAPVAGQSLAGEEIVRSQLLRIRFSSLDKLKFAPQEKLAWPIGLSLGCQWDDVELHSIEIVHDHYEQFLSNRS